MVKYPTAYLEFIRLFNGGHFFEAHETLENQWRMEKSGNNFYKGLIQLAVACHHLKHHNISGASQMLKSSQSYLDAFLPFYQGLDLTSLCWQIRDMESQLKKNPKSILRLLTLELSDNST